MRGVSRCRLLLRVMIGAPIDEVLLRCCRRVYSEHISGKADELLELATCGGRQCPKRLLPCDHAGLRQFG